MWTTTLDAARTRAERALIATATITRKVGGTWTQVATGRSCMAEKQRSTRQSTIDPIGADAEAGTDWTLSFRWNEDVRKADRVQVIGGAGGTTFPLMTVNATNDESLAVYRQVTATADELPLETYSITLERWNDLTGTYAFVGAYTVQATLEWGARAISDSGAQAAVRTGVIVATASNPARTGDWIIGLPWGGAEVTTVQPPVADRRDIRFMLHTAN